MPSSGCGVSDLILPVPSDWTPISVPSSYADFFFQKKEICEHADGRSWNNLLGLGVALDQTFEGKIGNVLFVPFFHQGLLWGWCQIYRLHMIVLNEEVHTDTDWSRCQWMLNRDIFLRTEIDSHGYGENIINRILRLLISKCIKISSNMINVPSIK